MNSHMNFTNEGENILKKLARNERMINYKNFLKKTGNPIIDNFNFFKRFGTLYNLLIDLLNEDISTKKAAEE